MNIKTRWVNKRYLEVTYSNGDFSFIDSVDKHNVENQINQIKEFLDELKELKKEVKKK